MIDQWITAMLINGDLQTSFIYNILLFLAPIYKFITSNTSGLNHLAMLAGVMMFIMSYHRGHGDGFSAFSTIKRNPFILSIIAIFIISVMLSPGRLVFVNIDKVDESQLNLITSLTLTKGVAGASVISIEDVPGFITIPVRLFNRYYYGVSAPEIKDIEGSSPSSLSYNRFSTGGDVRPGATDEAAGFHLGALSDFNISTNYHHYQINSEIDYVRSGMDQAYFYGGDDQETKFDPTPMDKFIISSLISEMLYYKSIIGATKPSHPILKKKSPLADSYINLLNNNPLYVNFFKGPKETRKNIIESYLDEGAFDKAFSLVADVARNGSSEYVGAPIASFQASQFDKDKLNSTRVTAPTIKVAESVALSAKLLKLTKAKKNDEIGTICKEKLFTDANGKHQWLSQNLQTPSQANIVKKELIKICNNHYEGTPEEPFSTSWDKKIEPFFVEKLKQIEILRKKLVKYYDEKKIVITDQAVLEMHAVYKENYSQRLRSDIFVSFADDLVYSPSSSSISNKGDSKLLTSLEVSGTKNANAANTNLPSSTVAQLKKYLRILAFMGELNADPVKKPKKSSLNKAKLVLTPEYIGCDDQLSLKYTSLPLKPYNDENGPLKNVFNAYQNLMVGGNKNQLFSEPLDSSEPLDRTKPSEDLIRSLMYQSFVEDTISKLDNKKIKAIIERINNYIKTGSVATNTNPATPQKTISVCQLPELIDGLIDGKATTEKEFFKKMISSNMMSVVDSKLDGLLEKNTNSPALTGNYRANHILHFFKSRYNSIFPGAGGATVSRTVLGSINLSDVNAQPYLSYYYPHTDAGKEESFTGWLSYFPPTLFLGAATGLYEHALSHNPFIDNHIFVKDNNLPRIVPLLLTGNVLKSQQINFIPENPEKLKYFTKYYLPGLDLERIRIFKEGNKESTTLLGSVGNWLDDAADALGAVVDGIALIFNDESFLSYIHRMGIFQQGTTWLADMVSLPEINRFLNNSTMTIVSALSSGDFSFGSGNYSPPSITSNDYVSPSSVKQKTRYAAYLGTIVSPAYSFMSERDKFWRELYFLSPAPGMLLYNSNTFNEFILETTPSEMLANVAHNYNAYKDDVVTSKESQAMGIKKYHETLYYSSIVYAYQIATYHTNIGDVYLEYITDPTKAHGENMRALLNFALTVVPIAKFKVLLKAGKAAYKAGTATKKAAEVSVEAKKAARAGELINMKAKIRAGQNPALLAGGGTAVAASAGGSVAVVGGSIAKSHTFRGKVFSKFKSWFGSSIFMSILAKFGYWIIVIMAIPLLIQVAIMWIMFSKLIRVARYLLMKKIIPMIFFFGSMIKTIFSQIYNVSMDGGGRISGLFGKVVEDPLEKAIIPFIRISLEIVIFYYLFAGIVYYGLYHVLPPYAIFVYDSSLSVLFEAGVSVIIIAALWLTKSFYDLIDTMYPIEFTKELDDGMEAVKY